MQQVVLSLRAPGSWVTSLLAEPSFVVRILDCKIPPEEESIHHLVEISGPEQGLEGVVDEIRKGDDVVNVQVTKTRRGKVLGIVESGNSHLCRAVMRLNTFCRSCFFTSVPDERGRVRWSLTLDDSVSVKDVLGELEKNGVEAEIISLSKVDEHSSLSPRQETIVRTAIEKGYFDYPRRISLSELAKELSIHKSTLSEILRRGQKKIVRDYLETRFEKSQNS